MTTNEQVLEELMESNEEKLKAQKEVLLIIYFILLDLCSISTLIAMLSAEGFTEAC